jgi:hypothetical protein
LRSAAAFGWGFRYGPELAFELPKLTKGDHARELLEQKPALPATAKSKFPNQLLVPGLTPGATSDAGQEITVGKGSGSARHTC